jgi:hypothetical protein
MNQTSPPNPELAALPDLFLLNPTNRAFVEGKTPFIDSGSWLGISVFLFFGAVFSLIGAGYFWSPSHLLTTLGVTTEATVTARSVTTLSEGRYYNIAYTFRVNEQEYSSQEKVYDVAYEIVEEGSTIGVIYVPHDPRIFSRSTDLKPPWIVPLLAGLAVFCLFLFGRTVVSRMRDRHLSKGYLLRGEVTDWRTEIRDRGDGPEYVIGYLNYTFVRPDGNICDVRTSKKLEIHEANNLISPRSGAPIAVLFVNNDLFRVL